MEREQVIRPFLQANKSVTSAICCHGYKAEHQIFSPEKRERMLLISFIFYDDRSTNVIHLFRRIKEIYHLSL